MPVPGSPGAACGRLSEGLLDPPEGSMTQSLDSRTSQPFIYRFFGGPPLAVIGRLILLSILVGVILAAIGLYPWYGIASVECLIGPISYLGFGSVGFLWAYFF